MATWFATFCDETIAARYLVPSPEYERGMIAASPSFGGEDAKRKMAGTPTVLRGLVIWRKDDHSFR